MTAILNGKNATFPSMANNIILGDCIEVMQRIPDESIDIVITSPPYNLLNSTGNGMKHKTKASRWPNAALQDGYEHHSDNMPYKEYIKWQQHCLAEMFRIIKQNGAIFYNNKNRIQSGVLEDRSIITYQLPLRQIITWQRAGGINFNDGYFLPVTEQIYLICKPDFLLKPTKNKYTDVWYIPQESNNPHPAPFPLKIPDRILESVAQERGIVLDPFGGSGTTAIAAIKHKWNFIHIDTSESYCTMALKRINQEDWQNKDEKQITLW